MKSKIKRHSRSVLAVILTLSMLVSCMMVGLIATDAARVTDSGTVGATVDDDSDVGGGKYWGTRHVYFRAPDGWNLSAYPVVQAWAVQSTSASSGTKYAFKLFDMTLVGTTSNSRLFWGKLNGAVDHSGLGNSEYIAFTANTSSWNTGNFFISTCGQYTKPLDYAINNSSSGAYLFSPSDSSNNTATNNNTISGDYNGTGRNVINTNQTFSVITDGVPGAGGGSVDVTAYYQNGVDYTKSDAIKSSGFTVDSNDTNATRTYENAVEGTKVTMTANPATGCAFVGYYDAATGGNLISEDEEFSYYVLNTKTVYARFISSAHNVIAELGDSTISTWSDGTTTDKTVSGGGAITLPVVKSVGNHKFTGWTVTDNGGGTATLANADKNDGTATVSVDNDNVIVTANFEDSTTFIRWSLTPGVATSFKDYAIDTTEGATINLPEAANTFDYVFYDTNGASDESGYRWFKQSKDGNYPEPAHDNTKDSTQFYAKTEVENDQNNLYGKRDFSIQLDAGIWKVRKVGIYYDTGEAAGLYTLGYNFWKSADYSVSYYLAGQYSDGTPYFFGSAWNTTNNQLTLDSGNYTKTFTTSIPAGTIQFKVVVNGDWNEGSYPSGANQTYVIKDNATSVTFTFDPSNHTTSVTQTNSGGATSGWLYSGDAANVRTEVEPYKNYTAFDSSKTGDDEYGKFRFMYGNSDTGLNSSLKPSYYKTYSGSNAYWAELTESIGSKSQFYFGLCNYSNKGNLVGKKGDDQANDSHSNKEIKDSEGNTLFKVDIKENSNVSSNANYMLIYSVDWSKVSAIGVKAYDNSKSTNNNNSHSDKVDYQFYYKAKNVTPVEETKVVDIYAKNGTLRETKYNRFTNLAKTEIRSDYFEYTENGTTYTSIAQYNADHTGKEIDGPTKIDFSNSDYVKMTNVPVGAKIKLRTYLSGDTTAEQIFQTGKAFKDTHYLKAYSFNGMTYAVHSKDEAIQGSSENHYFTNDDEYYEEIWTVRAVNTQYYKDVNGTSVLTNATLDGKAVEVTPIYYMKDNTNCKTFYIDGYDGTVQNAWGNLLCVYPYYEKISNKANAFGGYPGQPMLFWGGKYQMEVPLTVDGTASGAQVKGLTMHNSFWDLLHRDLDYRCNKRNHAQTYDYDDFYKLNKEKNPDTIIFDFKYRTTKDNFTDGYQYINYNFADSSATAATYNGSAYNGVELVTDYYGRQVDAFGNLITNNKKSSWDTSKTQDTELLFVSTGYKDTYVGEYATIWAVYAPKTVPSGCNDTANGFIGYISSSMLYLNSIDRVNQYTDGTNTDSGRMSWPSFINTYNHLKSYYTGVPALITYEKEIWNNSKDKANRSDGKWYYSNKTDKISASIKIQYGSYKLLDAPDHSVSSDAWRDDAFDSTKTGVNGEKNIGSITECSAYFTNTSPNLLGKTESGDQFADSTKQFTFLAVPSGSYRFAGWVRYSNGKYYEISENEAAESNMSANDVYIARFVDAQVGSLTLSHVVEQTVTYTGKGTPSITVIVKNGDSEVSRQTATDGNKIDISQYIKSDYSHYTIDISLSTDPDDASESYMREIVSSSGNFEANPNKWNESGTIDYGTQTTEVQTFTVQQILDSGITSLRYVSHLSKPRYTYAYQITYKYYSRFWGKQTYTVDGEFKDDIEAAANIIGSKTDATLKSDFIINHTPYEKNFRQKINWNYTGETVDGADAMVNTPAGNAVNNKYTMTAIVDSSNTVDDMVTAEIILPYKWDFNSTDGYTASGVDVYDANGNKTSNKEVAYDESIESTNLSTKAYSLFTYDNEIHTGGDNIKPSDLKLVQAAPYVIMGANNHTVKEENTRTFSGTHTIGETTYTYFTVNNINYYYGTVNPNDATGVQVTSDSKFTVTWNNKSYNYAVKDGDNLYTFVDDTKGTSGQYDYMTLVDKVDGVVENTGTKKYFTRWDIYNSKSEFVASSYNSYFNYTGYDNYVVKAIYNSSDPNQFAFDDKKPVGATITYLDDSRNQWNKNGGADYASVTKQNTLYAADKLFVDFAITYTYNGKNINTIDASEAEIKTGMVIERLDVLDAVDSGYITGASYYANKYKDDEDWKLLATPLANGATGLTTAVRNGDENNTHSCYNSKIAANVDGWGKRFGEKAPGSPTENATVVDNFNRLQWFYTINNSTQVGENDTNSPTIMKNYAYRAISYIIVESDGVKKVYLCDAPAYFTIYDTATRVGY